MGVVRPGKAGSFVEKPFDSKLEWQAKNKCFNYWNYTDGEGGKVTYFKGIILEPSMFTVVDSGLSNDIFDLRYHCKYGENETLVVRKKGYRSPIAVGDWKSIKEVVKSQGGQYAGIVGIWLLQIQYEGDAKPRNVDELCEMIWTGGGMVNCWSDRLKELKLRSDEIDGYRIEGNAKNTFEYETKYGKRSGVVLDFEEIVENEKTKPYIAKAIEKWEQIDAYLKASWEGNVTAVAIAPGEQEVVTAPDPTTSNFDPADQEDDDDLPF